MPAHRCEILDAELGVSIAPADDPNFINSAYEVPTRQPEVWLQVRAYVGTEYRELNRHVLADGYQDDLIWGGMSTGQLRLNDAHPLRWNLPCKLVDGQKIRVLDYNGIRTLGHWYVRGRPDKTAYGKPRPNGSYRTEYAVDLVDAWVLMQRKTYSFTYTNQTAGQILIDAFRRAGFDTSGLDPAAGPTLESHEVVGEYPAAVAEQMMSLLDWTYWFDVQHDPPKPYAGPKESELNQINLEINEGNWDRIFAPTDTGEDIQFELAEATENYANEVTLVYRRKHSTGKATFQNGSNVVLGYTGDENWISVVLSDSQGGVEIEIPSTGATYKLQKNNSTDAGVNELILSSNYDEADTVNGVEYIIKGAWSQIRRRNSAGVLARQQLQGGDGIQSKTIVKSDVALTYAEAALVANFELSLYSRQYYRGRGLIPTSYHADWLLFWPGKTLPINLPNSKEVVGVLRLEGVSRRLLTSRQRFPDGAMSPALQIELTFTPAMYLDTEQIRAIFRSTRKVAAVGSQGQMDTEFIENLLAIKDCGHVVPPLTAADTNPLEAESQVATRFWPTEPARSDYSRFYEPGAILIARTQG